MAVAEVDQRIRPLSERQKEIARLVAEALSNKEIAQQLHVSEQTIKNYLYTIYDKLGIWSRVELTRYAIRAGIIEA
jgi:DNA-binding NarL/FixJ family response regulator